jgi:hypothetical protein
MLLLGLAELRFPRNEKVVIESLDFAIVPRLLIIFLGPCPLPKNCRGCLRGNEQKKAFFLFFCLLLFDILLKYLYVCQKENVIRQQAPDLAENRKS